MSRVSKERTTNKALAIVNDVGQGFSFIKSSWCVSGMWRVGYSTPLLQMGQA